MKLADFASPPPQSLWLEQAGVRSGLCRAPGSRPALPPKCIGLKFFNVFGANEYHKGGMRSVVARNFAAAQSGEQVKLFKSHRNDVVDGGQKRDFV
jgi:hypothetical protein